MSVEVPTAVTVSQMAKMCGLSRARFYQLIGSAFPYPVYSVATRRPFFDQELQKVCLEVRRKNCGIDGKPILFYSRRLDLPVAKKQISSQWSSPSRKTAAKHKSLIEGLKGLGLSGVTEQQVEAALQELYPQGGADDATQLREVFVHLMRSGPSGPLA